MYEISVDILEKDMKESMEQNWKLLYALDDMIY